MTAQGETPSGKGAGDENFPVGSWLMPAALRPHIALFYAYARAIDDVADNPDLAPDVKIRRLNEFAAELTAQSGADPDLHKSHRNWQKPSQHRRPSATLPRPDYRLQTGRCPKPVRHLGRPDQILFEFSGPCWSIPDRFTQRIPGRLRCL